MCQCILVKLNDRGGLNILNHDGSNASSYQTNLSLVTDMIIDHVHDIIHIHVNQTTSNHFYD